MSDEQKINTHPFDITPPKKKGDISKVWICVPTANQTGIHVELVARLIHWAKRRAFPNCMVGVHPIDHARNEAVRVFLNPPKDVPNDFTHLFFCDDDTVPPYDAIDKLLALDKPVATGLTPILRATADGKSQIYNAFIKTSVVKNALGEEVNQLEAVDHDGPVQQVERCGGSCLLIRRDVLEKLGAPWFLFQWNADFTGFIGEDLFFCDRVKEAGFEIWCDPSVRCKHFKLLALE